MNELYLERLARRRKSVEMRSATLDVVQSRFRSIMALLLAPPGPMPKRVGGGGGGGCCPAAARPKMVSQQGEGYWRRGWRRRWRSVERSGRGTSRHTFIGSSRSESVARFRGEAFHEGARRVL